MSKRTRSCVNGQYGGEQCSEAFEEEQKICETKECPIGNTLGQKPAFYPKITVILILQKCEFCKK